MSDINAENFPVLNDGAIPYNDFIWGHQGTDANGRVSRVAGSTYTQSLPDDALTVPEGTVVRVNTINLFCRREHREDYNVTFAIYSGEDPFELVWSGDSLPDSGDLQVPTLLTAEIAVTLGPGSYFLAFTASEDHPITTHPYAPTLISQAQKVNNTRLPANWGTTSTANGRFQFWAECTDVATAPVIDSVNGNDVVRSNASINISGSALADPDSASIIQGGVTVPLSIAGSGDTYVNASPVDVHSTQLDYGSATVRVTVGGINADRSVSIAPVQANQYVVGASIDATNGLAEDGGADGDTWEMPSTVKSSSITLSPDTNIILDPAVQNGTVIPFWRKTPGANDWVESQVTVNGGPGPVGDRDTTSTPYKASEDGLVYFRYPNGDNPNGN